MKSKTQQKAVTTLRFLFPLWAIVGIFSLQYIPSKIVVAGDAAATASNILAHKMLFSLGIIGSLITQIIFIFAVLALYQLFKKVNENHARLMVIFALVGVPIAMLNTLNRIAALMLSTDYLAGFDLTQMQSLVMFFLDLNAQGLVIASIFWGLWLFPYGYLVFKSGYFPKILGVLVIIAGVGYVLSFFAHLLLPNTTLISVLEITTIGETIFMLWVIIRGAKLK